MEARATLRYFRISPRKARRLVDLVRGKKVEQALVTLRAMPHAFARTLEKIIRSAVANAEQAEAANPEEMVISVATVDPGPTLKRIQPRAQGRAFRILKRTSHITVVLSDEQGR